MIGFILRALVSALAVIVTVVVLPEEWISYGGKTEVLVGVAIGFGVVNGLIRPFVKVLGFPLKLLTLGTTAFILNAAMLLGLAWAADRAGYTFTLGGYPPDVTVETVVVAAAAALLISLVSTAVGLVVRR
jgi:putative membrane protein